MSSESCNSVNKFTTCNLKNSWCSLGETKETTNVEYFLLVINQLV